MQEIERRAEQILAAVPPWIWDGDSLPVPVEDIADSCFGLLVRDVDDMTAAPGLPDLHPDHSLSGLLLPAQGEIWLNAGEAQQWPARRRFTIGHELGHFCLHHTVGAPVWCRTGCLEHETRSAALLQLPPEEAEANAFAAALLMPARLVRAHYKPGIDFFSFCDRFGASGSAMGKRLHAVI